VAGRWFRHNGLLGMILGFLLLIALCGLIGTLISPHNPNAQDLQVGVTSHSSNFWLGTDSLGRDIVSRTVVGARSAIIGPILIALGTALISIVLGVYAGYRGGLLDSIIMRFVDFAYSTPPLLLVVVIVGLIGGGYFVAVAVLVVISVPYDIRVIRAVTLEQRGLPYIEAARTLGISDRRIMARHIVPNVVPFVVINSCLEFAFGLVTLAALSFLGLGSPPGTADWGRMLDENRAIIFQNPAAVFAPGILLVATAAAVNLVGDMISERFSERALLRAG